MGECQFSLNDNSFINFKIIIKEVNFKSKNFHINFLNWIKIKNRKSIKINKSEFTLLPLSEEFMSNNDAFTVLSLENQEQ